MKTPPSHQEREGWLLLWGAALRLLQQDEEEVRAEVSSLVSELTGRCLAPEVAAQELVLVLVRLVGREWPAGALALLLAALLTALDSGAEEVDTEVDRAFDRNEVNCYQEACSLALALLPPLSSLLSSLSPRLQAAALSEPLPDSLARLFPSLPAAVTLYSVRQCLEYLAARAASSDLTSLEAAVTSLVFQAARCPAAEEVCDTFLTSRRAAGGQEGQGYFLTQVLNTQAGSGLIPFLTGAGE